MSRIAFFVVAAVVLIAAAPISQVQEYVNAGVLPYSTSSGEARVLLGFEGEEEVWSDFVGVCTPGETPAQTAAREFVEETREAYAYSDVLRRLQDTAPVAIGRTRIFLMEVPEISAIQLGRLAKSRNSEKISYCWVPLGELLASIDDRGANRAQVPSACRASSDELFDLVGQNLQEGRELRARLLGTAEAPSDTGISWQQRCGR